ncbi:MAG: hypothetical protein ACE5IW_11645 [bacterium]
MRETIDFFRLRKRFDIQGTLSRRFDEKALVEWLHLSEVSE